MNPNATEIGALSGGVIVTKSAGPRDWHVGAPAHPFMVRAAGLGGGIADPFKQRWEVFVTTAGRVLRPAGVRCFVVGW